MRHCHTPTESAAALPRGHRSCLELMRPRGLCCHDRPGDQNIPIPTRYIFPTSNFGRLADRPPLTRPLPSTLRSKALLAVHLPFSYVESSSPSTGSTRIRTRQGGPRNESFVSAPFTKVQDHLEMFGECIPRRSSFEMVTYVPLVGIFYTIVHIG